MKEELFRKKSLDKIKTPESLNDYVQVSNPGVWLLLAAVVLLLVGAFLWGTYGYVENTVQVEVLASDGEFYCLIPEGAEIQAGMTVKMDGSQGTVVDIAVSERGLIGVIDAKPIPADGVYSAEIVTERIHPISFVLN